MSLESKHYVATPDDVAQITREIIAAQKQGSEGRATYLRALIATTQAELGQQPRQRAASPAGKLTEEEKAAQLAALEKVHERFYVAVVKAAKALIDGPDRGGLELNKRTNFARSSASTLRRWVRAGNDITGLVASRTTKAMLAVTGRRKGPSPKVLRNQANRFGARLQRTIATWAAEDPTAAARQWEQVKAQIEAALRRQSAPRATRRAGGRVSTALHASA